MEGKNKVILVGNIGSDPELRFTQGGQAVLNIRLATTESWFDKEANERKERTEWHNVVVWGKRAEGLAKILAKGAAIFVEGGLRTSSFDKDGQKHYRTEIHAEDVLIFNGAKKAEGAPAEQRAAAPAARAPF